MSSIFSTQQKTDSRTEIVTRAKAKLKKRQHTLLVGCFGAGKSWLLDEIRDELKARNVLHLSLSLTRKAFVVAIIQHMYEDGLLSELGDSWEATEKAVRKQTVEQLTELIQPHTSKYTYVLDDLERATERTCTAAVLPLLDGVVLAAADISSQTQVKRIAPVINHFRKIEVPPLTKSETTDMLWSLVDHSKHKRHRLLETQVWNISRGVPGVVADVADQLGESGSIRDVRQLHHEAPGVRYVGLLPAVLIVGLIMLVLMRYTARGFSDPYIYVFTASGYTILRMAMNPIQKWADG